MRSNKLAVISTVASVLLSCGAVIASAQGPSDPCSVATQQQASQALGVAVKPANKINANACQWAEATTGKPFVTVMYWPPASFDKLKSSQTPGVEKSSVSGVGDDALSQVVATQRSLFVKKGATVFMVRVYGVPDLAKQLTIETALAKFVAAKL
jgi:hypothetical protein